MGGYIHPTADKDYWIDTRYLEVGETALFDLRDLRDRQVPDPRGVKLAKNVMAGQFEWSTLFGDGSQRLIGRAEEIDQSGKANVISDIDACDCPSETLSAFLSPDNIFTTIGQYGYFTATGVAYRACGGEPNDYTIFPSSWSIPTPGIVSLSTGNSPTAMLGLAAGTSSFTTPVQSTIYGFARGTCYVVSKSTLQVPGTGTVAAIPVNFRQTDVQNQGSGVLKFTYEWDSSSGNNDDLSQCQVQELVAYPGGNPFYWSSPPYASGNSTSNPLAYPNPGIPGTDAGTYDIQDHPSFQKPYTNSNFTASQTFQFSCSNYYLGTWQTFAWGPASIARTIQQGGTIWTYTITKSGSSASTTLP